MDDKNEIEYVRERLQSINDTERRLVSFLGNFATLIDTIHDKHVSLIDGEQKQGREEQINELINNCYDDLSYSSIHIRRELKLLELKLPLPPNLSKKASDVNNQKLKQLLN